MLSKFLSSDSASAFLASSQASPNALRAGDNSISTAKFVGTLKAGSSSANINFKGGLKRSDRVDFFKVDVAPGASFSSQADTVKVKGGKIRITTYFQIPGQPLTKFRTKVYAPGSYSEEFASPFSNNFGITFQVYSEVKLVNKNKTVTYQSKSLFT